MASVVIFLKQDEKHLYTLSQRSLFSLWSNIRSTVIKISIVKESLVLCLHSSFRPQESAALPTALP